MAVRKDLPSLTGLLPNVRQPPSLERLGYFQTTSASGRGMVVASKIKQGFKLRLVAVRKHRNMPPRRGWGMGWRGWRQRFCSGRSGEPARRNEMKTEAKLKVGF